MRLTTRLLGAATGAVLLIGGGIGVVHATTTDHNDTAATTSLAASDQTTDRDQNDSDRDTREDTTTSDAAERDDTPAKGAAADRAKAAAQAAVPGATVRDVERDNDADSPRGAYEVELVNQDGSTVEVNLDADYKVIAIDRDRPDDNDASDDSHDNDH